VPARISASGWIFHCACIQAVCAASLSVQIEAKYQLFAMADFVILSDAEDIIG
jgi:hypothetical protein